MRIRYYTSPASAAPGEILGVVGEPGAGESMVALEDPMEAAKAMAPFVRSVPLKDQVLTVDPLGSGSVASAPLPSAEPQSA